MRQVAFSGLAFWHRVQRRAKAVHDTDPRLGLQPEKTLQHYRSIAALPEILGKKWQEDADYLDTCRRKRNTAEYDRAGVATEQDAVARKILRRIKASGIGLAKAKSSCFSSTTTKIKEVFPLKEGKNKGNVHNSAFALTCFCFFAAE